MGQERRNFRADLQQHRINAIERTFRPIAPSKEENNKLPASVTIVIKTDTLQNGVAKKCETKKYGKYDLKCPPQGIMFLPRIMALMLSTAAPNTIKTWTDLLIRMMATTQPMNFNILKKKPGKTNLTHSLFLNQDFFTGTIA